MKKSSTVVMTSGAVLPILIKFMIPIMLTSVLQQLYGAVDSAVVGRFSGPEALGAIGATSSLTNLILSLFVGMSAGTGVIVAQFIGAEDDKSVSSAVHTSVAFGIASGLFLMIFGGIFAGKILQIMNVPEEILPLAKKYMTIFFLGSVPSLLYNYGSGILRAAGDSKKPLYFLIVAAVINVTFNLIFVIVFKMGVSGVAISTIMSQTVSAILVIKTLMKAEGGIKLYIKRIKFDKKMLLRIVKIGVPAGIQSSVFSFSNTIIQSTINTFGKAAVAGCAASSQVENFIYMILNAMSVASSTFISQNFGAGKFERCSKSMKISFVIVIILGTALGLALAIFKIPLLSIFTNDHEALMYGSQRIMVFALTYTFCAIMEIISGAIKGYGDAFSPMIISLVGVAGSRLLWIFTVLPFKRAISTVYIAFPVSWILTAIVLTVRYKFYRKKLEEKYKACFTD